MDNNSNSGRSRIHPLVATAAGAVIVACGVGVAAMTGVLPRGSASPEPTVPVAAGVANTANTAAVAPPAPVPAPAPAPVAPPQQVAQAAPPPPVAQPAPRPVAPAVCQSCGVVESIGEYKTEGHGTGVGAVGGAVAGGLVGHAFGGGNGRTVTTVLGALGGGLAGNSIERHVRSTTSYRVRIRMENGTYRTFTYANVPPVSQGQRVRIVNGVLHAG